jgi:hypothetical protein
MKDGLYTGWTDPPIHMRENAQELIERSSISDVAKYHALELCRAGYTVLPKVFDSDYCGDLIGYVEAFIRNNNIAFDQYRSSNGVLPRFTNLHTLLPKLAHLFTRNPILLEIQDFLFDAPSSLYTSLYYERGSQQPFHRDTPVFATRPEYYYFGNTLYLEGADLSNGCLDVIPGGHLIGELDREALAKSLYGELDDIPQLDNELWIEYQNRVVQRCHDKGLSILSVPVNAGDTIIWHPQLPHSGSRILDFSKTRHSFVFHTVPVGFAVYHQNCFFRPSKAFPAFAHHKYGSFDGRMMMKHPQGIALGDPVNVQFSADQLKL